jgi:hypothetical protein
MRTLLKNDLNKLKSIQEEISSGFKKVADLKKPRFVQMRLNKLNVQNEVIGRYLIGDEFTVNSLIYNVLKNDELFVPLDPEINEHEDSFIVSCKGFEPVGEWISLLNKRDHLLTLQAAGREWLFYKDTTNDFRNYFISNGELRYGIRGKNDYDGRLLGEIVTSIFIMTEIDYDKELKRIKKYL